MFFKALCSFHSALFQLSYRFISFMALYFIHGAFIFGKELLFKFFKYKKALYHSAFIQISLSAGKRFIIALSLNFF
jgi:hypothetical protein